MLQLLCTSRSSQWPSIYRNTDLTPGSIIVEGILPDNDATVFSPNYSPNGSLIVTHTPPPPSSRNHLLVPRGLHEGEGVTTASTNTTLSLSLEQSEAQAYHWPAKVIACKERSCHGGSCSKKWTPPTLLKRFKSFIAQSAITRQKLSSVYFSNPQTISTWYPISKWPLYEDCDNKPPETSSYSTTTAL